MHWFLRLLKQFDHQDPFHVYDQKRGHAQQVLHFSILTFLTDPPNPLNTTHQPLHNPHIHHPPHRPRIPFHIPHNLPARPSLQRHQPHPLKYLLCPMLGKETLECPL